MSYIAARTAGADPLVFTFHGTGGDEHQFHSVAGELMPGATVVSPRGDVSEAGHNRYFRRTGEGVYDMNDLAARTESMAGFLRNEKAATGAARTVALGYSNGANILASVLFSHPDLVDHAILMHPLIPWKPEPQPGLAGRRILITAGRADPICPAPLTEALADYLRENGAELSLDWHPGGHELRNSEIVAIQEFLGDISALRTEV